MAVRVTKETQPRVVLKGANSGSVNSGVLSGSGDGVRVSMTFTATAEPLIVIPYGNVAEAQLEAGSFATSYIPTSGSQQTRSADVASIPVSAFGYNDQAGTVIVEVGNHAGATAGSQYVVSLDNSSSAERMQVNRFNGNYILDVVDNSVSQVSASIGAGVDGSKVSFAYALNNFVATENGDTPVTDTTATVPTPSKLSIGIAYNSTAQLNGHIKSIQYYPRRLTNTQLQELTA